MANKLSQFWQELKRRNVVRVITVYAGAAFVIIELINNITEPLKLPEWTPTLVIVLLVIGFPIAIIFSWIYDIHPEEGVVKTEAADKVKEEDSPKSSNSWKIASYISFVVIVGLIVLNIIPRTGKNNILDKSIAVLPFTNMSTDEENTYFIDGVMESILDNLCKIKDLRVPGRTSVIQYRDNPKPISIVAEEMDVAYVLEGSGQKIGNRLLLTVQLIIGNEDRHIWSKQYDRVIEKVEDLIDIQKEIAQLVAFEIEVIITPEEERRIERVPTTSLTAYDFYQRGREEHEKYWMGYTNREALGRAEGFYHKALEYDSTFALAYTGLALVYWNSRYSETYLTENFIDSVLILADKALSYDNKLSEAFMIKGWYYQTNNKKEQAIIEYDRAIQFNPNEWRAYFGKGRLYYNDDDCRNAIENYFKAVSIYRGPFLPMIYGEIAYSFLWAGFREESEKFSKETLALDGNTASYYFRLAESESFNGNFDKAIQFQKRSLTLDSTNHNKLFLIGNYYIYLGQIEEALGYYIQAYEIFQAKDLHEHLSQGIMLRLGQTYLHIGKEEEAAYYLSRVRDIYSELDDLDRAYVITGTASIFARAGFYACLGDKDRAFEYLRLLDKKEHFPVWLVVQLKVDSLFDSIRDEPEFQQILRDVEAKYQAEHERVRKWLEENDRL